MCYGEHYQLVKIVVTTHVVRLKLFRLKAEGVRKARLTHVGGESRFSHQIWLQEEEHRGGEEFHISNTWDH